MNQQLIKIAPRCKNTNDYSKRDKFTHINQTLSDKQKNNESQQFETSIEVQVIDNQQNANQIKYQGRTESSTQIESKNNRNQVSDQKLFAKYIQSLNKVKLCESQYEISIKQNDDSPSYGRVCDLCNKQYQQTYRKVKNQIKLLKLDHKIIKQQIILQIKEIYSQLKVDIISHFQNFTKIQDSVFILSEKDLKQKLKLQSSQSQRLNYLNDIQQLSTKTVKKLSEKINIFNEQITIIQKIKKNLTQNPQSDKNIKSLKSQKKSMNCQLACSVIMGSPNKINKNLGISQQIKSPGKIKTLQYSGDMLNIKTKIQGLRQKLIQSNRISK